LDYGLIKSFVDEIVQKYETRDVFLIAEKAGVAIIYESWHPATVGEFEGKTNTIRVNQNALEKAKNVEEQRKKIVAHELGHFLAIDLRLEKREEEKFAHLFAEALLEKDG
jgi:Zn-dependent peptidase ImmA (M78 family)